MATAATPALTLQLGEFVASLARRNLPVEALEIAKLGFTDCIGTMLAGSIEDAPRIVAKVLDAPTGSATLTLGPASAPAPEAALINGTAAHALDYDDVALRGHPSTVIVPAILAEAETLEASGLDMLKAFVAGYEVWAEIALRDPDQHHMKGWHPTGIFGAPAAAAACAFLHKLSPEKCAHAIALAASGSAGLMANFGTMTKPFHAGQSSRAGLLAARLAKEGFTASLDAFEHAQGYLNAISPALKVDRSSPVKAGTEWRILEWRLNIKKYPLCYGTHRAIDGMLDLLDATPVRPEEVAKVTVLTSRRSATILRNARPKTGLEAKFSMQFAMASSLIMRRVGLAELTDEFVRRPDVQALLPKVVVEVDESESENEAGYTPFDQVTVETTDGRRLEGREVAEARGGANTPLKPNELEAKFRDCLALGRPGADAAALFGLLQSLDKAGSAREISAALGAIA
jgi:2-methylcitrate dehydratase PrpD